MTTRDEHGVARSLSPSGVLPQQAEVLDARLPLRPGEVGIDVELLNIDSASWAQLRQAYGDDAEAIREAILEIVRTRGKMHNPFTGSGGMLVGTVSDLGEGRRDPRPGTRIASLVSLSLTPLVLDDIVALDPSSEQITVAGRAILFASGAYVELDGSLPDEVALATLDVCGAPAWAARLAEPGMRVAVLGAGGRSGMLACAEAARRVGSAGRVLGLCWPASTVHAAHDAGAEAVVVDCTDPIAVRDAVESAFGGKGADLVFVCTNVPGCEGGAILACTDEGRVVFFSMATSFTSAALIAEGLGKPCELTIGNGFVPGHARLALDLVRSDAKLLARFSS